MVRPSARGALRLISTWNPLHRQVSRVGAREDLASVCADDPIGVVEVGPIAHQTTDGDRHVVVVDRRNPISRRQSDELIGLDGEEDICTAEQRVVPSLGKAREGLLEVRTSRIATPKSSQSALAPPECLSRRETLDHLRIFPAGWTRGPAAVNFCGLLIFAVDATSAPLPKNTPAPLDQHDLAIGPSAGPLPPTFPLYHISGFDREFQMPLMFCNQRLFTRFSKPLSAASFHKGVGRRPRLGRQHRPGRRSARWEKRRVRFRSQRACRLA
jgi:hypothetical protein